MLPIRYFADIAKYRPNPICRSDYRLTSTKNACTQYCTISNKIQYNYWWRVFAWNIRFYYPYWQLTYLHVHVFIFWFVSEHCLRSSKNVYYSVQYNYLANIQYIYIYIYIYISGCDNSKFSAVPDWYSNDCCHVLELVQTWDSRCT